MISSLLDALFPACCPACRRPGGVRVCSDCWAARPPVPRGNCPACLGAPPCRSCVCANGIDRVVALGSYEDLLVQVVRLLKFHDRRDLARFLGRELAASANVLTRPGADSTAMNPPPVWIPVPSHRSRVRERGYDHVRLLARAAARASGLAWAPLLTRIHATPPLYRLTRAERQSALAGAFRASGRAPERAILVDDLLTTGATALAAAACLREAGARGVDLVVAARA